MDKCYIAVGAIVKNEGPYIEEWIEYHRHIGIEKFYIVDNGSYDDTLEKLEKYVSEGIVDLFCMEGTQMQLPAYNFLINQYKETAKWIAFIDVDEFIYIENDIKLYDFLKEFEDENALGINWICIGPSGRKNVSQNLVIESYTQALPLECKKNRHIKSIIQPIKSLGFEHNPHVCNYINGFTAVDENHKHIEGNKEIIGTSKYAFTEKNSTNRIALLHYYTKSIEEYYYRCMKGKACGLWNNYSVFVDGITELMGQNCFEYNKMLKYKSVVRSKLTENIFKYDKLNLNNMSKGIPCNSEQMYIIQSALSAIIEQNEKLLNGESTLSICEENQSLAITIGNTIENLIGMDTITIHYLEEYCEKIYQISIKDSIQKTDIGDLNQSILMAGYSLIE